MPIPHNIKDGYGAQSDRPEIDFRNEYKLLFTEEERAEFQAERRARILKEKPNIISADSLGYDLEKIERENPHETMQVKLYKLARKVYPDDRIKKILTNHLQHNKSIKNQLEKIDQNKNYGLFLFCCDRVIYVLLKDFFGLDFSDFFTKKRFTPINPDDEFSTSVVVNRRYEYSAESVFYYLLGHYSMIDDRVINDLKENLKKSCLARAFQTLAPEEFNLLKEICKLGAAASEKKELPRMPIPELESLFIKRNLAVFEQADGKLLPLVYDDTGAPYHQQKYLHKNLLLPFTKANEAFKHISQKLYSADHEIFQRLTINNTAIGDFFRETKRWIEVKLKPNSATGKGVKKSLKEELNRKIASLSSIEEIYIFFRMIDCFYFVPNLKRHNDEGRYDSGRTDRWRVIVDKLKKRAHALHARFYSILAEDAPDMEIKLAPKFVLFYGLTLTKLTEPAFAYPLFYQDYRRDIVDSTHWESVSKSSKNKLLKKVEKSERNLAKEKIDLETHYGNLLAANKVLLNLLPAQENELEASDDEAQQNNPGSNTVRYFFPMIDLDEPEEEAEETIVEAPKKPSGPPAIPSIHYSSNLFKAPQERTKVDELTAAKLASYELNQLLEANLASLRAIERVLTDDKKNVACQVAPAKPDGDCGFSAIRRYLLLSGQNELAKKISRKNIIQLIEKRAQQPAFTKLIESILRYDNCADLASWCKAFRKPGGIWLAEHHMDFLSLALDLKFYNYCLNQDSNQFEPELSNEVICKTQVKNPVSIHLAHVSTQPLGKENNAQLNHFEALCLEPTQAQAAQIALWLNEEVVVALLKPIRMKS